MVRIHVGQPLFLMKSMVNRFFAQTLHNNRLDLLTVV